MPLIVGQEADAAKPQKIAKDSFLAASHTRDGKCFVADPTKLMDYYTSQLHFLENDLISCALSLNLAELEAYCGGTHTTKFQDLELFKQFNDRFKFIGKFGTVNPLNKKDWLPVYSVFTDTAKFDGTKWTSNKWDAATATCKSAVIGYDIKVIYSKMGFANHLQYYNLGAIVSPITADMVFVDASAATTAQDFAQIVQISYHEAVSDEELKAGQAEAPFLLPDIFEDVFYPFNLNY